MGWRDFPFDQPWTPTVDELDRDEGSSVFQNVYINGSGAHAKFPNIVPFVQLPSRAKVYLEPYKGAMVAVTGHGRCYTIDNLGGVVDRTGASVPVETRPVFSETDDELLISGGADIMRLAGLTTEILSPDAPISTHVAYMKGYVVALERSSGRFRYSNPGLYREWPPLNVLAAEDKPDPAISMLVSGNTLYIAGPDSIEVYKPFSRGEAPFYQMTSYGHGVYAPHLMAEILDQVIVVNRRREVVIIGPGGRVLSRPIAKILEKVTDWKGSWIGEVMSEGERFLVLGLPTRMLVMSFGKGNPWCELVAWSPGQQAGTRPPFWSCVTIESGTYIGAEEGLILKVTADAPSVRPIRANWRSAIVNASDMLRGAGKVEISNVRLRVHLSRSAVQPNAKPVQIRLRCRMDDGPWSMWISRGVNEVPGLSRQLWVEFGSFGAGSTVQMEYETSADAPFSVVKIECQVDNVGED